MISSMEPAGRFETAITSYSVPYRSRTSGKHATTNRGLFLRNCATVPHRPNIRVKSAQSQLPPGSREFLEQLPLRRTHRQRLRFARLQPP